MEHKILHREKIILIFVASLIFLIYLFNFSPYFVTHDSIQYTLNIINLRPGWLDGKPLYIFVGKIFHEFGISFLPREKIVYVFDFLSAIFATLTCVNLYFIYRYLFRKRYIGILSSLCLAFSPLFFFMSVIPNHYTLMLFLSTLSVLLWLKKNFFWWAVCFGLAISSYAISLLLIFPFVYSILKQESYKREFDKISKVFSLILLICLVFYGWVLLFHINKHPGIIKFYYNIITTDYLVFNNARGFVLKYLLCFMMPSLFRSIGFHNMFLFIIMLFYFFTKKRILFKKELWFLFWWFIPYFIFPLLWSSDNFHFFGRKFVIFILPALSIILVHSFSEFSLKRNFKLKIKIFSIILIVFLLFVTIFFSVKEFSSFSSADELGKIEEYSKTLAQNIPENSVLITAWETPYVQFYNDRNLTVIGWFGSTFPEHGVTEFVNLTISELLAKHGKVYITNSFFDQESLWKYQNISTKFEVAGNFIRKNFNVTEYCYDTNLVLEKVS